MQNNHVYMHMLQACVVAAMQWPIAMVFTNEEVPQVPVT